VAASSYWRSHGFAFARFRSAARNNALSERAAGSQRRPHRLDRDRVPSRRSKGRLSWFGCRAGGRARAWPAAAQHPAPGMQVSRVRRADRSGGRSPALALLPRLASNGDLGGRPEAPRDLGWPKEPSAPSLGAPLLAADHHQSKARLTARRPAGSRGLRRRTDVDQLAPAQQRPCRREIVLPQHLLEAGRWCHYRTRETPACPARRRASCRSDRRKAMATPGHLWR
jgi:hypothetical protein